MNKIIETLGGLLKLAFVFTGVGALIWLFAWFINEAIKSWQAKDENFQLDCIVLPICAVIFVVAVGALGIACLLFPDWAFHTAQVHPVPHASVAYPIGGSVKEVW